MAFYFTVRLFTARCCGIERLHQGTRWNRVGGRSNEGAGSNGSRPGVRTVSGILVGVHSAELLSGWGFGDSQSLKLSPDEQIEPIGPSQLGLQEERWTFHRHR